MLQIKNGLKNVFPSIHKLHTVLKKELHGAETVLLRISKIPDSKSIAPQIPRVKRKEPLNEIEGRWKENDGFDLA